MPSCDISPEISCSASLTSEYGHILSKWAVVESGSVLDQQNAFYGLFKDPSIQVNVVCAGVIGYSLLFLLSFIPSLFPLLVLASLFLLAFSLYLLHVLLFELQEICIVCFTTHLANFIFFGTTMYRAANKGKGRKGE